MKQDNNRQTRSVWSPPANEGDIPKWVQRIRLQPEVTASYLQVCNLNPLKDYVVEEETQTHYHIVNEDGSLFSVLKCLAYEIKKPLVSSLPKALVQLSKRKFVAGTMVRVVNGGQAYSSAPHLAGTLLLSNYYCQGSSWATIQNQVGMVLSYTETEWKKVYGVRIDGVDYAIGESGLEAIHNV
jgi:hypothetical protein